MTDTTHERTGYPAANGLFWLAAPDDVERADSNGLLLVAGAIGVPVAVTVAWSLLAGPAVALQGGPSTVLIAAVVLLASAGALYSGWKIAAGFTA